MKKLTVMFLFAFVMFVSGCESERPVSDGKSLKTYECVGAFDAESRDPNLTYKASTRNIVVGAIFFELIAPPVVVLVNETFCPTGIKPKPVIPPTLPPAVVTDTAKAKK